MSRMPGLVSFVAPSGTGKTTLIEGVIRSLRRRNLRVAVLKHDAHRLELDTPGKDTWRFRRAGAWRALIASADQLAVFSETGATSLGGLVDAHLADADIVITEGFRRANLPAIRVYRQARGRDDVWEPPANLVAWASDVPVDTDLPVLPLNDPDAVAAFLVDLLLGEGGARHATLAIPIRAAGDVPVAARLATALGPTTGGRVLVVHPRGVDAPGPWRQVEDIRPDAGPLGGLLTALAAAGTAEVVLVGTRHHDTPRSFVERLMRAGPRAADVVVPVHDGFHEPLLALYGHRCLPAIHAALISGEPKMDGWWGQVRVHEVAFDPR